jgi:hypothetical protein
VKVNLWKIRKLVEFGHANVVLYEFPEEFQPDLETTDGEPGTERAAFSVTIADLLMEHLLTAGEKLVLSYKPRNGERKTYEGTVHDDGSLEVMGQRFNAPSYAALYAMENAGTTRTTVNGWSVWKTSSGRLLSELREEYLARNGGVGTAGV